MIGVRCWMKTREAEIGYSLSLLKLRLKLKLFLHISFPLTFVPWRLCVESLSAPPPSASSASSAVNSLLDSLTCRHGGLDAVNCGTHDAAGIAGAFAAGEDPGV